MGKYLESGEYSYDNRAGGIFLKKRFNLIKKLPKQKKEGDSKQLFLRGNRPGISFGYIKAEENMQMVGVPEGDDGNILVVGGNGSGKTLGIAKPTLASWQGGICATDIKGELSDYYVGLYQRGVVARPPIIFDPTQVEGPSYDPFWWLLEDDENSLISNIWELVLAIIPTLPDDNQPFWVESEQALFAASLLYFFKLGLSFSETVCKIMSANISSLCKTLSACGDVQVKMLLGDSTDLKADVLASIDRGLRNKLMLFASDPYISHAFRGAREGAMCFTWDNLKHTNIFLRIPANRVEQWGGAINLMLTQLLHYLERWPEKYSSEAEQIPQTLLLLDEFARFGKLNMLPAAMATLRSKKVNICLLAQSIAQIDAIYGVSERRIILDNCQFQAILRANDPETQEALCKLIGTRIQRHHSVSQQLDASMKDTVGYSIQINEIRDWMVCPHELATLEDVLLLTPHGFLRVKKVGPEIDALNFHPRSNPQTAEHQSDFPKNYLNEGATMTTLQERLEIAGQKVKNIEHQQRAAEKQAKDKLRKKDDLRKYIIGGLVLKYFPDLRDIEPETTSDENKERFKHVEAFLVALAGKPEIIQELQAEADARLQLASEDPRCVSGHDEIN